MFDSDEIVEKRKKLKRRKEIRQRVITILVLIVIVLGVGFGIYKVSGSQSFSRFKKTISSNYNGLNRNVKVYSYSGDVVMEVEGDIDISEDQKAGKVMFDLDGKRYSFYNAMVIVTEK